MCVWFRVRCGVGEVGCSVLCEVGYMVGCEVRCVENLRWVVRYGLSQVCEVRC